MEPALDVHRLHFAFTVTFHYIFPQLTMGLALLLVYLKTKAFAPITSTTIAPRDFGAESSVSILPSGWSPAFPWNFSLARTGPRFPGPPAESSGRRSPWKACFPFFSSPVFWDCFCLAKSGWDASATGGRHFSYG